MPDVGKKSPVQGFGTQVDLVLPSSPIHIQRSMFFKYTVFSIDEFEATWGLGPFLSALEEKSAE